MKMNYVQQIGTLLLALFIKFRHFSNKSKSIELENFNLGANQLIHLDILCSCIATLISPADFTTLQMTYNSVKCQL